MVHLTTYTSAGQTALAYPSIEGGGYARSGKAYVQVGVWIQVIGSAREYIEIELTESLTADVSYRVSFYITFADSLWYATRNIGAHLSAQPHVQNVFQLMDLTPQVSYTDTAFLDDKIRWTEIAGSFTAQGGERYLAIGNFDNDANTDTAFVQGGGNGVLQPESFWQESGYFIDDVSVVPDSIYLSNYDPSTALRAGLKVYPNPAQEQLTVQTKHGLQFAWLTDLSGRRLMQLKKRSRTVWETDLSGLPKGIYLIEATTEDGRRAVRKVVKM